MNLLLILSALLSALSGTGLGARGTEQAAAVAEQRVLADVAAPSRAVVTKRPANFRAVAGRSAVKLPPEPRVGAPLYLARLRR